MQPTQSGIIEEEKNPEEDPDQPLSEEQLFKFTIEHNFNGAFQISAKKNVKVATAFEFLVLEMLSAEEKLQANIRLDDPSLGLPNR